MNRIVRGIGLSLVGSGVGTVVAIMLSDIFLPIGSNIVIGAVVCGVLYLLTGAVILLVPLIHGK